MNRRLMAFSGWAVCATTLGAVGEAGYGLVARPLMVAMGVIACCLPLLKGERT